MNVKFKVSMTEGEFKRFKKWCTKHSAENIEIKQSQFEGVSSCTYIINHKELYKAAKKLHKLNCHLYNVEYLFDE